MNKLFFGVLAFATGVLVEKKFGVTNRILEFTKGDADPAEELEETEEEPEVVMTSSFDE